MQRSHLQPDDTADSAVAASDRDALPMQFVKAKADVVQAINQRWLLKYWNGLRGLDSIPRWDDVKIDDLSRILDTVMFCDLIPDNDGGRFLIRRIGRRIALSYGGDFLGRFLDEALPEAWRGNALTTYRKAIDSRRPVYNAVNTRDRDGCMVHLERLLLPFSSNGTAADRVLASIETVSLEGRFAQENLGRSPHATSDCALVATIEMD